MHCYMRHLLSLTVCLLLTVDIVVSECCSYCCCIPDTPDKQGQPCGEVSVESNYAFVNSTINITCTLYENISSVNASDLYFTWYNGSSSSKINGDVTVVNKTTSVLQHVVSVNDNGQIFYCEAEGLPYPHVVERDQIYTEYYPQTPTNFSCMYENKNKLFCSWAHPVKYLNLGNIHVTFEWRTNNNKFNICQEQSLTSCGDITNNVHGNRVDFRLNVTNTKKSITTSNTISFAYPNTLTHVYGKPNKMDNFIPIQIERISVKLSWTSSSSAKLFCIKYNSTDGIYIRNTSEKTIIIENLTTYTMYQFELVGFYTENDKRIGLPSDPAILFVRTLPDVGKCPPRVIKGGFTIDSRTSSKVRNITIYWQNFEDMNLNGPIAKYEVICNISEEDIQSHIVEGFYQSQFTLTNIPFNASVRVCVKAGTEVGMSEASALIYIPSASDAIKPPAIMLEILSEDQQIFVMLISWKALKETKATGYTIYWCESTVGCQKHINWINVTAGNSNHNITDLDRSNNYLFGVSMETEDLSSGFIWESCYYKRNGEPNRPQSVEVHKIDQTTITVTWSRPSCDYLSPFIDHYILFWCPAAIKGGECVQGNYSSQKTFKNQYRISELYPGTRYCIWSKAVTTIGKESLPAEKSCKITTLELVSEIDNQALLIIVFPMSVVIIVVILFRKKLKKELCTAYLIEPPKIYINKKEMKKIENYNELFRGREVGVGGELTTRRKSTYSDDEKNHQNGHTLLGHVNPSLHLSNCQEISAEQSNKTPESTNENCCSERGHTSENTPFCKNSDYVRIGLVNTGNEFTKEKNSKNKNQEKDCNGDRPIQLDVPLIDYTDSKDCNGDRPVQLGVPWFDYTDSNQHLSTIDTPIMPNGHFKRLLHSSLENFLNNSASSDVIDCDIESTEDTHDNKLSAESRNKEKQLSDGYV